jgi:hypothetical protein
MLSEILVGGHFGSGLGPRPDENIEAQISLRGSATDRRN